MTFRIPTLTVVLFALAACGNPIKVDLSLQAPCDQTSALSGVSTYRIKVTDGDAVLSEGQYSSDDFGGAAFDDLAFGESIQVSIEGWQGPNTPATVATTSAVIGRTLPMNLTVESGVDAVSLKVLTGTTNSFGSATSDEGVCQTMAEINGRHGHTSTYLPSLNKVLLVGGAVVNPTNPEQEALLDSVELFDPATGTFERMAAMGQVRAYHTATLLEDGTVLIVGGFGNVNSIQQPLGSWVRIDPTQPEGSNYTFGAMASGQGRAHHTATRLETLPSLVVIAGGCVESGCDPNSVSASAMSADSTFNSIEIFDSTTNTATIASVALKHRRAMHAASYLGNGFILFSGGVGAGGVAECNVELFNYSAATISDSGTLPECPHLHQQVTLSEDSAMIVGGQTFTGSNTTETNRVYIWRSGAIETNVITMTTARSKHEAVLLDDGSVLVVGGMRAPGGAVAELIVYEPSVGGYTVSSVVLPPTQSRDWLSAAKLPNNQVLVTGGKTTLDNILTVTTAEIFFGR